MPKITFIEDSGEAHTIEAQAGVTVMQAALDSGVPGILADCGGNCSCATCQVYVDAAWQGRVGAVSQVEKDMIECALYPQDNSRLSCQIAVTPELDGLVVRLPKSQV
jgi:ferredoxin, 2Fe-2S